MKNYADRGWYYPPWPLTSVDNTFLDLHNREEECDVTLPWYQNFGMTTKGSLSNNDGDGNENGKKQ